MRRSVDSYEPISEPPPDICDTNSTRSFSTALADTEPRLDMIWEISRISSSSSMFQSFVACSSPSASGSTAERSAPAELADVFLDRGF